MIRKLRRSVHMTSSILVGACLTVLLLVNYRAQAINLLPTPTPIPGAYGLEATKRKAPPTESATITTPGNGATFTSSPITVNGICPKGLLVQILNNGVMVGAVLCTTGSFSIQVSLFAGTNELTARVYDDLEQEGPVSNTATVTYNDLRLTAFGALVTLTSSYGRRSAPAGSALSWPLQLSGGAGPYAFSIDWGDGSKPELKSQALPGVVPIAHVYKKAGIYQVNIRVTDTNGVSAFLQVVAVASGKVDASTALAANNDTSSKNSTTPPQILWIPTALALVLLAPTYWLGRRSQLVSLHNKMLKERDSFKENKQA